MMCKRVLLLPVVLCIALLAGVGACKKSANNSSNVVDGPAALSQLIGELRLMPYTFSVNAGRDVIIYCERGTKFHFYTNSFKDASGRTLSSGEVAIVVTEIYKTC